MMFVRYKASAFLAPIHTLSTQPMQQQMLAGMQPHKTVGSTNTCHVAGRAPGVACRDSSGVQGMVSDLAALGPHCDHDSCSCILIQPCLNSSLSVLHIKGVVNDHAHR